MLCLVRGRSVIVTGGASGMGAACARLLADAGASVVIVDLDGNGAVKVAAGIGATVVSGDITDSAFCDGAVAAALERNGRLDALVNAAGTIVRADALGTDDEAWHRQFRVNVDGTFFMSRAAVRAMQERGSGAIVNFGSIWGGTGGQGHAAYCAAKGAVHNLTRAMALDHARDGIRVNAVAPGTVDSPWVRRLVEDVGESLDELKARQPMGRLGTPDEIAEAIVYLAGAEFVTGTILSIDGGLTAT
jgi:NAD(P)-dependent dehydrogenase (short-subunit alcohol dehydrogenase family)